jgi:hypothetical protein
MAGPLSDQDLRLECARLAAVFSEGGLDRAAAAARLYRFVRRQEVLDLLHDHCRGKHAALAAEAGVSEAYVCRVFKRECPPSGKLLRLIGYQRVTAYEPIAPASSIPSHTTRDATEGQRDHA